MKRTHERTTKRKQSAATATGRKRAGSTGRSGTKGRAGASAKSAGPDAIELLKSDHRKVEALFARFEKLGEKKTKEKQKVVAKIIKELSMHAAIEEQVIYPAARKLVKQTEDQVLEALEEHHIVKWTLSELDKMRPTAERYDAKVTVLKEMVEHHVEEEEDELFPTLKKKLGKDKLRELGAMLAAAKKVAPTHPHPRAPDEPPGNLVIGAGAALVDRAIDAGKAIVKRARGKSDDRSSKSKSNGRSNHAVEA